MIVNNLDQMEKIVANNPSLSWIGWSVAERTQSFKAMNSAQGVFVNGTWFLQKIYEPSRNGWDIPGKFIK